MNYTMLEEVRELGGWNAESEALSVYQALEQLTDKRRAQGNAIHWRLYSPACCWQNWPGKQPCKPSRNGSVCAVAGCSMCCPKHERSFRVPQLIARCCVALIGEQVNQLLMELLTRERRVEAGRRGANACGLRWQDEALDARPPGGRSKGHAPDEPL
jgi:hypothetical protein